MKIGFSGLELPEGSVKYTDENIVVLTEKEDPKKVTPFYAEFVRDEFIKADAIAVSKENISEILIADIEKLENRPRILITNREHMNLDWNVHQFQFIPVQLQFDDGQFADVFAEKNNKTLRRTILHKRHF